MADQEERLERPRVAALDEILGQRLNVLDDGFIRVVDYMGSDDSIVQAARVSYGKGTKKIHEDRGLIRYLMRHRHTTPFEMCEIKLHVRVPMDCWRQWIRHRTACLAEGTRIYFDLPGGIRRRGRQLYSLTIEEIWRRFQPTRNRIRPDKQRNPYWGRDRVRGMHLRQVNEETLRLQHTRIVNVVKNGSKPVFRMRLWDGKEIEATSDHRFLFASGWNSLKHATGLRLQEGRAVWNAGGHYLYVNGDEELVPAQYQNREWLDEHYNVRRRKIAVPVWADESSATQIDNLTTLCGECHRFIHGRELEFVEQLGGPPVNADWKPRPRGGWNKIEVAKLVRIESFEYVGEKETYDLEVEGPYHNFVANGIITHNSVNEYSTRYSVAIDAVQKTPPEDWRLQSGRNRQGSEDLLGTEQGQAATRREEELQRIAREVYEERIAAGIAREQARKDLPLSTYTEAYWKIDLQNLLHFLSLRMDAHAQAEIRAYATVIGTEIVRRWVPISWEAFLDYRMHSLTLSRIEARVIAALGSGDTSQAVRLVREAGLLPERDDQPLKRNREREELEQKLTSLNLPVPWIGATSLHEKSG